MAPLARHCRRRGGVGIFSRLVMEKGLDVFSDAIDELRKAGAKFRVLVIGEGPAREWLETRARRGLCRVPLGADLGKGVASMDVLFFPSVTETFGNVTLEAMAVACRWSPRPPPAARAWWTITSRAA
jgi:glycosyltransferase involved in cell wall biosynthesis